VSQDDGVFSEFATGKSFARLTEDFRIGESTLNTFDKKFLKWFRMTYWQEYVVGQSGFKFFESQFLHRIVR
jgi:hypothetical protein